MRRIRSNRCFRSAPGVAAALLLGLQIAACGERGTSQAPPGTAGTNPNLGTVPERPIATPTADRAALLGSLQRDREQVRHDADVVAVDEARGATIGTLVGPGKGRNNPRAEASPAPDLRVEGGPPRAGTPPTTEGATVGPPMTQPRAPIAAVEQPASPPGVSVPAPQLP